MTSNARSGRPEGVDERLARLGLSRSPLQEAALASDAGRRRASENHPPVTGGFNGWADAVAALRDGLLPHGWVKSDRGGYSVVISPNRTIQIACSTGDEGTGREDRVPRTKAPKGPETMKAVAANQLSLFPTEDRAEVVEDQPQTWILLTRTDMEDRLIRAELSLPSLIDEEDHVCEWSDRIILPEISIDEFGARNPVPEPSPDIDISVPRRVG